MSPHSSDVTPEATVEPSPRVSVIIANWNAAALLRACLASLQRQTWRDFEVIVADNASSDGSVDMVRAEFPDVRVLPPRYQRRL